jgi:hypothetical protein
MNAVLAENGQPVVATAVDATKKKTEYLTVVMTDGRSVDFPTSAKAKKEILTDAKGTATGVRFDFVNGQTRTVLLEQVLPLFERLAVHGLSQKGGDSYASEKDVDDSVEALDDTLSTLLKGQWSEGREGGFAGVSILAKALAEFYNITIEQVRVTLKEISPKEKMLMRQVDGIREIVQRLEAEKAKASGTDIAALMTRFAPK